MTAWNITEATYNGVSLDVTTQESNASDICFSDDGLKLYVVGTVNDAVQEFDLGTAWDVSTATHVGSFSVSSEQPSVDGVTFKPDGTKMYVAGTGNNSTIAGYNLSTAWDVTTATHDSSITTSGDDPYARCVQFKPDGLKMYVFGSGFELVNEYVLSIAWDVSTATLSTSIDITGTTEDGGPWPYYIFFKPDGLKMYAVGLKFDAIYEYDLGTAWLVSTAIYNSVSKSVATEAGLPEGLFFSPNGGKMYVLDNNTDIIYTYDIPLIPTATMDFSLEDTTAGFTGLASVNGDLLTTLGSTSATITGVVVISGSLAATLGNTRAWVLGQIRRWAVENTLDSTTVDSLEPAWVAEFRLQSDAESSVTTFYNPQQDITIQGVAVLDAMIAYVQTLTLIGSATVTAEGQAAINQWLLARATGTTQIELRKLFEATLEALAVDSSVGAFAALVTEAGQTNTSTLNDVVVQAMDSVTSELLEENTLLVAVTDTLEAEAGDSVQALGHYSQNIKALAGAWLVLKTSGDIIQGWVMNVEGDRPFSQYEDFDFNSMTRIGNTYFAAGDEGLYALSGNTDAGSQIDAHVTTMMLDFDTTAQKRVVAAYLGYTSTGTVVLKVRSVDDGQLVEHWYEAQEVRADAPRAGYKPLGRGLKSRYWQFELANVDGADFELDKLELQPIKLSRRV